MADNYYTNLIGQLRDAADWVNHQMDPCPDYENLLEAAADAIQNLYDWLPPFLLDEGDSWTSSSSEHPTEHPSEGVDKPGTSDQK